MRAAGEAAFERFVATRSDDLMRLAVLLAGDRQHAEDLVQTALLKAYRRWQRIDGDDPYPYVRRVLVTSAAGWWRRRSSQEIVDLPSREHAGPDDTDGIAERHRVADALDALPARMRAVLVLRYAEDLSAAATAEALGISVHTVTSQTTRGLARLRSTLADSPATVLEEC